MITLFRFAPALLALLAAPAWAGDLTVVSSTSAPVVVLRGGQIVGTTPFTLPNLPEGPVELGFREAPLSATAFTQQVAVPEVGGVRVEVNLPERIATTSAAVVAPAVVAPVVAPAVVAPAVAAPAVVAPVAAAPQAPAAPPVPAPAPAAPAGDIYVTSTPPGAAIFLDGAPVDAQTPFVVRGVALGKHTVEARSKCARGAGNVTVVNKTIARADLALVERPGSLSVTTSVTGSRVLMDGVDVGKAPLTLKEVACGKHAFAIRAPGYLESTRDVSVHGYETLNLIVTTSATPAPPSGAATGRTVQMLLRKEEFGTLVLDVTPLETALTVDGIEIGTGPRTIEKIATGPHAVWGRLDGYTSMTVDITVEPDLVTPVVLSLSSVAPLPTVEEQAEHRVERKPVSGRLIGRVALNVGASAVGLGASAYSITRFVAATDAYTRYNAEPSDELAQGIYDSEVVPSRIQAYVGGGIGILGILTASGLWVTTEF